MGATQSCVVKGVDAAIAACVAEERNPVLGQELSEEEGKQYEDLARDAKVNELDSWKRFKAFEPLKESNVPMAVVSAGLVHTRKMADGKECAQERLVAKGYQDPDLKDGNVDT